MRRKSEAEIPWGEIPPVVVKQKILSFEIGLYKDIHNMTLSSSDDDNDQEMEEDDENDKEELERIERDLLQRPLRQPDKRDQTPDSSDPEQKKRTPKTKIRSTPYPKHREEGTDSSDSPRESSDSSDDERPSKSSKIPTILQPGIPKPRILAIQDGSSTNPT